MLSFIDYWGKVWRVVGVYSVWVCILWVCLLCCVVCMPCGVCGVCVYAVCVYAVCKQCSRMILMYTQPPYTTNKTHHKAPLYTHTPQSTLVFTPTHPPTHTLTHTHTHTGGPAAALTFARTRLAPFVSKHPDLLVPYKDLTTGLLMPVLGEGGRDACMLGGLLLLLVVVVVCVWVCLLGRHGDVVSSIVLIVDVLYGC